LALAYDSWRVQNTQAPFSSGHQPIFSQLAVSAFTCTSYSINTNQTASRLALWKDWKQMETSAMKDTDDGTDMVSRIKADNKQAEAELVEHYDRSVMSVIRREVGATTVADDLYQETF